MSVRCSTVPTQTLFGTVASTSFQTQDVVATSVDANNSTILVTSQSVAAVTQIMTVPTTTLYDTRCRTNAVVVVTSTQAPVVSSSTTIALTTQPGGNVVVQTIVQTITSQGSVVIETQTASPVVQQAATSAVSLSASHTDTAPIVGGVVGAAAFLVLLAGLLWCLRRRRRGAMASRHLDDFFSDPSNTHWNDNTAGGAARVGEDEESNRRMSHAGTFHTARRRSSVLLDLDQPQNRMSQIDVGDSHWAALTQVEAAQTEAEEDLVASHYGRPSSRQSLNTLSRPLSYHSMTNIPGLAQVSAVLQGQITPEEEQKKVRGGEPILLRNGSDSSSKSAVTPSTEKGQVTPPSDELVPALLSGASPPQSPLSTMTTGSPLSPNSRPRSRNPSFQSAHNATVSTGRFDGRPDMQRGSQYLHGTNAILAAAKQAEADLAKVKPRTWSSGTFDVPERPRSAIGLSGQLPAVFDETRSPRESPMHSPDGSPPLHPMRPSFTPNVHQLPGATSLHRGRASVNLGTPQYPNLAYRSIVQQRQTRSPPLSPRLYGTSNLASSSSGLADGGAVGAYPPSQYSHLDVHKTKEERDDDRRHAIDGLASLPSRPGRLYEGGPRRHWSMSGDMLEKLNEYYANGITTAPTASPSATDHTTHLSVRNADPEEASSDRP